MENVLTTQCKLIDYTKNLLLNSVNDEQEQQARRMLEIAKSQENYMYVN